MSNRDIDSISQNREIGKSSVSTKLGEIGRNREVQYQILGGKWRVKCS